MKDKIILAVFTILGLLNSHPAMGEHKNREWIKIETLPKTEHVEIGHRDWNHPRNALKRHRRMKRHIRNLESAVIQLQRELDYLRQKVARQQHQNSHKSFTCYLKTPLNGTFLGHGYSLVAARGKALRSCEKSGSFNCRENKLKCDA